MRDGTLALRRSALGITVDELAEALGLDPATVRAWEDASQAYAPALAWLDDVAAAVDRALDQFGTFVTAIAPSTPEDLEADRILAAARESGTWEADRSPEWTFLLPSVSAAAADPRAVYATLFPSEPIPLGAYNALVGRCLLWFHANVTKRAELVIAELTTPLDAERIFEGDIADLALAYEEPARVIQLLERPGSAAIS
ncbi:helix-turn-helix domain-containing protein [Microbacterium paludicola]|uniref:helix-turn-helix domain-containing protein n=1 Tax=Microbacterium paludicola TaxID=300019 RepID=UPI0031D12060